MADIIDQTDDNLELEEGEELGNLDELGVETSEEAPQEEPEVEEQADEDGGEEESHIPDKFRGKSLEDVIESYTNLEKEYGRRNNEIGELRKLTDDILRSSLKVNSGEEQSVPASNKIEIDELLDNPESALEKAIGSSPKLKALEEQLVRTQREEAKKGFDVKHPDAYELVASPEMQKWIQSSPIRQQMFKEANDNYNYVMADELFSWYKESTGAKVQEAKEKRNQKAEKDLKAAAVEKGTTGQSSKKIFRRADVLKLMRTNPAKYNSDAFQAELVKAYEEGRVR